MSLAAKLAVLLLVVGIAVAAGVVLPNVGKGQETPVLSDPDLSDHPIYSRYQFGGSENTIGIGTQPFYLPTGLVTEAMKRDAVLREALEKLGMEVRFWVSLRKTVLCTTSFCSYRTLAESPLPQCGNGRAVASTVGS